MKPMLAATVADLSKLVYPVLASPKLDGVRCLILGGVAMSRSLKPIPNKFVQDTLGNVPSYEGLDGELIVGSPTASTCFQSTTSAVMSSQGTPDFQLHVFDKRGFQTSVKPDVFVHRLKAASSATIGKKHLRFVQHTMIMNEAALLKYEAEKLSAGYEGVMLRHPQGPYKAGRSTLNEGWLLKLKRFSDSEAVVEGFEPLLHNANEAKLNELGQLARSSHRAGKVATAQLGSLIVRDVTTGVQFELGTGFTSGQRVEMWIKRSKLPGKLVRYKFQPTGVKERPRFPVFLGFRHTSDL